MKRQSWLAAGVALLVSFAVSAGEEKAAEAAPAKALQAADLFFTEPYIYLEPPIKDRIGMWLDVAYADIKYPYGFVNTADPKTVLIRWKMRLPITDADQLKKIKDATGLVPGDVVTVISALGLSHLAVIQGFSFVGNSPSTILVMADLKVGAENDASVYNSHGIALKGKHSIPLGKIFSRAPLQPAAPLYATLSDLCRATQPSRGVIEDLQIAPAVLTTDGEESFVVSYWSRPESNYEIEDVKLNACLLKPHAGGFVPAKLPLPLKLIQVYDLDQDGQAELYGQTGDGTEVCYVYLTPHGDTYQLFKKGMCAGY